MHQSVLQEKVYLEISQNSQEKPYARVSFLMKLQTSVSNFIKKETLAQVSFAKFLRTLSLQNTSEHLILKCLIGF